MPTQEDIDLYNEFWAMLGAIEAQGIDAVAYIRAHKVKKPTKQG